MFSLLGYILHIHLVQQLLNGGQEGPAEGHQHCSKDQWLCTTFPGGHFLSIFKEIPPTVDITCSQCCLLENVLCQSNLIQKDLRIGFTLLQYASWTLFSHLIHTVLNER